MAVLGSLFTFPAASQFTKRILSDFEIDCDWAARKIKEPDAPLRREYHAATLHPSEEELLACFARRQSGFFEEITVLGSPKALTFSVKKIIHDAVCIGSGGYCNGDQISILLEEYIKFQKFRYQFVLLA